ncbi:MAG: helix-hairpin-helix domain-containing protein [Cyclobacteriaceae bacterium]|nr:helix-hairpin-helix domain-containing protein [Cyclobacteriaceae bacterium]
MKKIRYWIIQLMGVSKTEANGVIFLFIFLFLIIIAPYYISTTNNYTYSAKDSLLLDSMLVLIKTNKPTIKKKKTYRTINKVSPEYFDPNNAPIDQLISIGFSKKQAQNISNYRNKGGQFKIKKDLLKIYSVDSSFYLRVAPFIKLPDKINLTKKKELVAFNINTADTIDFMKIHGIGTIISKRIVKFRDNIGGFININQLDEVYGIEIGPLTKLKSLGYITAKDSIKRININSADYSTLIKHVYINKKTANAIIQYRNQHSNYQKVDDLKKIHLISNSLFEKLEPYLTIE